MKKKKNKYWLTDWWVYEEIDMSNVRIRVIQQTTKVEVLRDYRTS